MGRNPGAVSFSAVIRGGERAERDAYRNGHSHPAIEHGHALPGVFARARPPPPGAPCRSSGFFAVAVRSARCDSHAPRLTAGALRVLSLDAMVGIFCACGAHKTPPFIIPVHNPLEATRDAGKPHIRPSARKPDGTRAPSGFRSKIWARPRTIRNAHTANLPRQTRKNHQRNRG